VLRCGGLEPSAGLRLGLREFQYLPVYCLILRVISAICSSTGPSACTSHGASPRWTSAMSRGNLLSIFWNISSAPQLEKVARVYGAAGSCCGASNSFRSQVFGSASMAGCSPRRTNLGECAVDVDKSKRST
jgi:hypothetical protein